MGRLKTTTFLIVVLEPSTTNLQSKVSLTPFHNRHVTPFTVKGIKKERMMTPPAQSPGWSWHSPVQICQNRVWGVSGRSQTAAWTWAPCRCTPFHLHPRRNPVELNEDDMNTAAASFMSSCQYKRPGVFAFCLCACTKESVCVCYRLLLATCDSNSKEHSAIFYHN